MNELVVLRQLSRDYVQELMAALESIYENECLSNSHKTMIEELL